MMTAAEIKQLTTWLTEQVDRTEYGEISIRIQRHSGQTRQVEKSVTIRERPQAEGRQVYG